MFVQAERIEKILADTRVSMEMEGFVIDEELTEQGRKILRGEVTLNDYITECIHRARALAYEV
jgi:hypothetical protein